MYLLSLALPLATFFPTIALVSAAPSGTQPLIPLSSASSTNLTDHDPRVCVANRRPYPFSTKYMILSQCMDAIAQFPSGNQLAEFRDYGEQDEYFLPQVRKAQDCQVTVSLPYGYDKDIFSWNELKIVGNHLASKCCSLSLSDDLLSALGGTNNKAAYVPTGQAGKIRIDMAYVYIGSLSIEGNATNITSDAILAA